MMDDQSLIQSAVHGDLEAFNHLVLAYQDQVYNQAYRILADQQAAEDAAQETFITAFRKLGSFQGGSFKAWLLRIVTNHCYDEIRREKRHPTVSMEPLNADGEEIETPSWLADPGESPEDSVERTEFWEVIQMCLNTLPLEYRTAVVLVDIQEMDYAEAAQAMDISMGTVKSRVARGRRKMREALKVLGDHQLAKSATTFLRNQYIERETICNEADCTQNIDRVPVFNF